MNIDWLLSQVFSYLNRFYKALASPNSLILPDGTVSQSELDKELTEALIFLVLSASIAAAGFDTLTRTTPNFPSEFISAGLLYVLSAIWIAVEEFIAWRLAGSRLRFDVFLRGSAYYIGVLTVLGMIVSFAFVGAVSGLSSGAMQQARSAIWSVFVHPTDISYESFPENWCDATVMILSVVGSMYVLLSWWRTFKRLSGLSWKCTAWAFISFAALQTLTFNLLFVFPLPR